MTESKPDETTYTLILTKEQGEFLKHVLDNQNLVVPVKFARVAAEVHGLVNTIVK